ncbi:hypothetical protein UY3_04848 [Chelonia mydas]|uniref:Uncharacterized protein n=1 Tax=Chelonia mydas TaxID=8469 RepID=M7BJ73_CHEMY|nr:hypothetical protein UY3_04848 [Chelonia mydas]
MGLRMLPLPEHQLRTPIGQEPRPKGAVGPVPAGQTTVQEQQYDPLLMLQNLKVAHLQLGLAELLSFPCCYSLFLDTGTEQDSQSGPNHCNCNILMGDESRGRENDDWQIYQFI